MNRPELTRNTVCKYVFVVDPRLKGLTFLHLISNLVDDPRAGVGIKAEYNDLGLMES